MQSSRPPVSSRQPTPLSHRWLALAGLVAIGVVTAGCNDPRFLVPAPTLRGITIPLPPPSFADEVMVRIDVEGNVPFGFDNPGTKAYLLEKSTGRGYFVEAEGISYTIQDVLVDVTDNCLETWFVDGIDGEASSTVDYKAVLREGEEACTADDGCSAMDDLGVCLCLEKWTVGC